ncbi:N-acetyl-1-D-myo-inositol-2-amino-2-deoxy-alpha-D-glucopyranoside deacetylase [Streptacidiphilus sp. MAP12-16]|uniref:PIG-L deacetylase family protein n=1 Tax=Streptacidiphilus sp. MAP12-16 TaxID=3156300 RepID=UPI003512F003
MDRQRGLMAVHAHPDDESLWTGGVLAQHAAEGRPTAVLTCTDGELADGTSFAGPGTRVKELVQALGVLGVAESGVLPYRDSGHLGRGRGSLCDAPFDELVADLVARIRSFRPSAVATYDAFGMYGHPDHVRVHRAVLVAVEAAACPYQWPQAGAAWEVESLWLATVPESLVRRLTVLGLESPMPSTPDARIAAAVDVRPWLDVKWEAVRSHASEFARGARIAAFEEPHLRELCLGTEWFLHRPGPGARTGGGAVGARLLADA